MSNQRTKQANRSPGAPRAGAPAEAAELFGEQDLHLFNEGTHLHLYEKLGAHPRTVGGTPGTHFAVWAPNAERVSVIGEWNGWDKDQTPLHTLAGSGIWEGHVPGVGKGDTYKYHVASRLGGHAMDKADPVGFLHELSPRTGSVVWDHVYDWGDGDWLAQRAERNSLKAPMSIYEVHLGSWRRVPGESDRPLSYRELAGELADYVEWMGFTHVELLPVMEHPFYGSWGYQTTGYFAPTSRYGSPQDFMYLIDTLHQRGIGVVLDWVPSHFPTDGHGLAFFDGTHLYEHADRRQGHQPDWDSFIFNYGRHEVRSFLLSSAMLWLSVFHADALRVDAVASMLYLDYSRKEGEWIPNLHGGRENLEAVEFLRRLNEGVYREQPDTQTMAEESTSWPLVSRPLYRGGLGFGLKWDMGWMHDTLEYFARDPLYRKYHHNQLTFRQMYAFTENFVLPLSHDEVVHGKGSLLGKMPGHDGQKFANLRLLLGYMYAQPGKKLLFMGGEIGQWAEWNHDRSLDWHLADTGLHKGLKEWVRDLNRLHRAEPALHALDCEPAGFQWIDCNDSESSVLSFVRRSPRAGDEVLVVLNLTPEPRPGYRLGAPAGGFWAEILNSDAGVYGGADRGNLGGVEAAPITRHGLPFSLNLTLPPLAALFLRRSAGA